MIVYGFKLPVNFINDQLIYKVLEPIALDETPSSVVISPNQTEFWINLKSMCDRLGIPYFLSRSHNMCDFVFILNSNNEVECVNSESMGLNG